VTFLSSFDRSRAKKRKENETKGKIEYQILSLLKKEHYEEL